MIVIGLKEVDAAEVMRQVLDAGSPLAIDIVSAEHHTTTDELFLELRPDVGLSKDAFVQSVSFAKGRIFSSEVSPGIGRVEIIAPLTAKALERLPPLPSLADSWKAAAHYAREQGEDVDALIAGAATTIEVWRDRHGAAAAESFAHDEVTAKNYRQK